MTAEPDPRALWDSEAEHFDEPADHGLRDPAVRAAWRALMAELIGSSPGRRIADLGCGTGTLSLLLADLGHRVDGLDFSAAMLDRARLKAAGRAEVSFTLGDAAVPPFAPGAYDVVLSRHVLWALPDPSAGLARWCELLAPDGRLVLIEGLWSTGAGLTAEQTSELVSAQGRSCWTRHLNDPALWGRAITDERYVVVSPVASVASH